MINSISVIIAATLLENAIAISNATVAIDKALVDNGGVSTEHNLMNVAAAINELPKTNIYNFGYVPPSDVADLAKVTTENLPSEIQEWLEKSTISLGAFVKSEFTEDWTARSTGFGYLCYQEGVSNIVVFKKYESSITTDSFTIPLSDIQIVPSKKIVIVVSGYGTAYNTYASGRNVAARKCLDSMIMSKKGVTNTINALSYAFMNDRRGMTSLTTQRLILDGLHIQHVGGMASMPACIEVLFRNCVIDISKTEYAFINSPVRKITVENCTYEGGGVEARNMFVNCNMLRDLDMSQFNFSGVTSQDSCLTKCYQLENFSGIGISCDWDFSTMVSLNHESAVKIINKLIDQTEATPKNCTLGIYLQSMLSDEEIAIAVNKNWNILWK